MIPVLLLCLTYFIGEAHRLYSSTEVQNWILYKPVPMSIAWNVKYLSEEVNRVIEGVAFLLMITMRNGAKELYVLVIIEYLVYRLTDIAAYFIDYKTDRYWQVALFVMTLMAFFYFKKKK